MTPADATGIEPILPAPKRPELPMHFATDNPAFCTPSLVVLCRPHHSRENDD